jgi:hypothetical protein
MSAQAHKDPSKAWLILFFVCFLLSIVGIGVWQLATGYNPDQPDAAVTGGH